jgi:hypothetical protein
MESRPPKGGANGLVRSVALLQVKLLLDALRDIALSPLSLAAALIDLLRIHRHPPRFYRSVLRLGEKTDGWIDLWSGARDASGAPRENVDRLLERVEEIVRDPHVGARRARVLKRWAERQVTRARQRAAIGPPTSAPSRDDA